MTRHAYLFDMGEILYFLKDKTVVEILKQTSGAICLLIQSRPNTVSPLNLDQFSLKHFNQELYLLNTLTPMNVCLLNPS